MKTKFILNPLTFPVWWYTLGLRQMFGWADHSWSETLKRSKFRLFFRYMRAPLYGDYSRSGRIISFFLRCALLGGKVLWLGLKGFGVVAAIFIYLVILPVAAIMIFYSLMLWL